MDRQTGFWRVRVPRFFGETAELAEKRRRQRIDAASRMIGHLFALVAWIVAIVVILHVLQVDLVPVLTSAGFIGAGLAIGGQHAVRDFISGMGILVEDRFGVGDRVVVETKAGTELEGVVEYVGAFSTRISSGNSTWHFSNGDMGQVRNLSQKPVTTEIEVALPEDVVVPEGEVATDAVAEGVAPRRRQPDAHRHGARRRREGTRVGDRRGGAVADGPGAHDVAAHRFAGEPPGACRRRRVVARARGPRR